ncbi:hypothetical protein PIB30_106730 [Stylosanthes scabra]|uniref:Uncharacterized protein n=1 Tax=Stylosanthes scabra TaxID=79078 RepID=A0ABU6SZE1_9FABA|nr:hypothetical protein [Stylosanthes scabra]
MAGKAQATLEGGSSSNVASVGDQLVDVSSPLRKDIPLPPPSPKRKRVIVEASADPKRPRVLEGGSRELCSLDRSFDASGFIEGQLLGPRAQEVLCDCDPMESIHWVEWATVWAATITKSVEPRLTIADEVERRSAKLLGDLKILNLQKVVLKEEKSEAEQAKAKAEGDLKMARAEFELSEKEEGAQIERLRAREAELASEIGDLRCLVTEEKVRADLAEAL